MKRQGMIYLKLGWSLLKRSALKFSVHFTSNFSVLYFTQLFLLICRNEDIENVITIDLHGQHVKQAMQYVKTLIMLGTYVPCKCPLGSHMYCILFFILQKIKNCTLQCSNYLTTFIGLLQQFKLSGLSQDVGHMAQGSQR